MPDVDLKLVCGNCGTIVVFRAETAVGAFQAAFEEGWDTIEAFGYNSCPTCPGVSVYLPMMHAQAARTCDRIADADRREELLALAAACTIGPPEGGEWPRFERNPRESS